MNAACRIRKLSKRRRLWNFYSPLLMFLATVLYMFAVLLGSWLEWLLAACIVAMFAEVCLRVWKDITS